MLDNNNIMKYFVRVPEGVEFNGAQVSGSNVKKIYFDENTQQIWVRGLAFSLDLDSRTALNTLIGEDTNKSVRTIAGEVINTALGVADANTVIDTLNEVLDWFHNLPEGDAGAVELVARVGKPAEDAKNAIYSFESFSSQEKTTKYGEGTVEVIELRNDGATVKVLTNTDLGNSGVDFVGQLFNVNSLDESTVLQLFSTEGLAQPIWVTVEKISDVIPAQAATGLYKVIEDAVGGIDFSTFATKSEVNAKIGNLGNQVEAAAAVYYTQEEADAYNQEHSFQSGDEGFVTTETIKTPAVEAVPYTNVMDVITDNERIISNSLNELNEKVNALSAGGITGITIGSTDLTVSDNTATITKSALQSELFDNTYASDALSYSYLGVTISAKESNGELTEFKVDPSELANRVSTIEDFDPWEDYQAPAEPGE